MSAQTKGFRDRVAECFRAHPREWVSAYVLMDIGGQLAFRTRVSECRLQLGMAIDNKVDRDKDGMAFSFYRYTPPSVPVQLEMHQ